MNVFTRKAVVFLLSLAVCLGVLVPEAGAVYAGTRITDPVWPIDISKSSSTYRKDWPTYVSSSAKHNGHDFVAPKDTPVYAVADGKVDRTYNSCTHNFAKKGNGGIGSAANLKANYGCEHYNTFGNYVRIAHGDATYTYYGHLTKVASGIKSGSPVKAGDLIGYVGSTGASTANHLHFEVRVGGTAQKDAKNPFDYLPGSPYTLTVNYNANGGSLSSDTYKLSNGLVYTIAGNAKYVQSWAKDQTKANGLVNDTTFGLSRAGYAFVGWGTAAGGGTVYDQNDASVKPRKLNPDVTKQDCSVTLYAIWEPRTGTEQPVIEKQPEPVVDVTIKDGTYYIKCAANQDYVLNAWTDGTPKNGTNVTTYKLNRHATQQWNVISSGDTYLLKNGTTKQQLNVYRDGKAKNGDNVTTWSAISTDLTQQWIFEHVEDGKYLLKSASTPSLVLTATGYSNTKDKNNVNVQTYKQGDINQLWVFVPVS